MLVTAELSTLTYLQFGVRLTHLMLSDIDGGEDFQDAHFHLSPHSPTQQNRAESSVPTTDASLSK